MSCPKNPTEFTLLKSVLNKHHVSLEDKKIITEGITQIFKDEKKKKKMDGGSDSAESKARRTRCSTAGTVVILLIALSMASGAVYTAHCYAPTQFGRLINATNSQIKTTIEVILDTGFLSISLDDPEFIKECIEWLKKASLLYLGNKIISGTDRVTRLARAVCTKLFLTYTSETSSEKRRKISLTRRRERLNIEQAAKYRAKYTARATLRRRNTRRRASPAANTSQRATPPSGPPRFSSDSSPDVLLDDASSISASERTSAQRRSERPAARRRSEKPLGRFAFMADDESHDT